jgi:hypothetical protein
VRAAVSALRSAIEDLAGDWRRLDERVESSNEIEAIARQGGNGLERWIEAAKKRLHHNVLAIALANCILRLTRPLLRERLFR